MHLLLVDRASIVPSKFLFFPSKPESLEMTASFFFAWMSFSGNYAFLHIQSIVCFLDCLYYFLTICIDFLQIKC